jgi:hypothetical protein
VNILDEDIPESQRQLLRSWRIRIRRIGIDQGRLGMKDPDIIPLLHSLDRPTFFTRDAGFWKPRLCHPRFCLVYLDILDYEAAEFIRRTLRHTDLNTRAKRMGTVVRVRHGGILIWRIRAGRILRLLWES